MHAAAARRHAAAILFLVALAGSALLRRDFLCQGKAWKTKHDNNQGSAQHHDFLRQLNGKRRANISPLQSQPAAFAIQGEPSKCLSDNAKVRESATKPFTPCQDLAIPAFSDGLAFMKMKF